MKFSEPRSRVKKKMPIHMKYYIESPVANISCYQLSRRLHNIYYSRPIFFPNGISNVLKKQNFVRYRTVIMSAHQRLI